MQTEIPEIVFDQIHKASEIAANIEEPVAPIEVSKETPIVETSPSKPPEKPLEQSPDNSSVYAALAETLFEERGLISQFNREEFNGLEQEHGGAGAVVKMLEKTLTTYNEEVKSAYDEFSKEYISLREQGVSKEEASALISTWEDVERLDPSTINDNEDLAKAILYNHYKATTKFSDARIEKEIQKKLDYGEIFTDAEEALGELKEVAKDRIVETKRSAQKAIDDAEKARVDNLNKLKETVKTTKDLWGVPLTDSVKTKMIDMMTKPVGQDTHGNQLNAIWSDMAKDPVGFQMKIAMLKITGGWDDIDKLTSKTEAKAYKKIEEAITRNGNTGFTKSASQVNGVPDNLKELASRFKEL